MRSTSKLCIFFGVIVLYGCAEGVAVQGEFPAAYPQVAELHSIAVYPFEGRDGQTFASVLTADLQSASLDGKLLFNVTTPEANRVAASYGGNFSKYARFGRSLGVQAIYFGDVLSARVDRSQHQEVHKTCVKSHALFKCDQWQEYVATCYQFTADYVVAPKVVDVRTSSLVYSNTVSAKSTYGFCSDQDAAKDPDQLIAEARANVAEQVRRQVAPFNATINVSLKKEAGDLPDADSKQFDGAVKFAESGRMDRACAQWEQMAPNDTTTNVSILYDLGVCAEVTADYGRALMLYSKADSLLTSPDSQVNAALSRVRMLQNNSQRAAEQAR